MKKHLANIVSSSRILGALFLFMCSSFSTPYLIVYCFCGFTDLIDGPIARKTNTASSLGAALDTIGDVLTYLSFVKILVLQGLIPSWLLIWLGTNIVIGFFAAFFALKKFGKFYLPHTYLGKGLGGFIFVLPIAIRVSFGNPWMAIICTAMSLALLEIFYIQIKNKTAKDFIPTVFHTDK